MWSKNTARKLEGKISKKFYYFDPDRGECRKIRRDINFIWELERFCSKFDFLSNFQKFELYWLKKIFKDCVF